LAKKTAHAGTLANVQKNDIPHEKDYSKTISQVK